MILNPTTTLPVELITFSATSSISGVKLTWKTATETNNSHFNIERSSNGKNWTQIHTEKGAGSSSHQISYAYTDRNPSNGISYYRLTQVDFDGKSKTYAPISVQFDFTKEIRLFPNPAQSQITVESSYSMQDIRFYDMIGNDVTSRISVSKEGSQKILANISELQSGVYFLHLLDEKVQFVKR